MPRRSSLTGTLALAVVCAGCAAPPAEGGPGGASFQLVADVREVMLAVTIPASDAVWAAGADEPQTDGDWLAIESAALALAESGNLLLMEGRARDRGEWAARTRDMIAAAALARDAARARDLDALLDAGDVIYMSCDACHAVYMGRD